MRCVRLPGCRWLAQGRPHAAGKGTVKEVMALVMRKCVESTNPGDFARVEHELQGKKAYCFVVSRQVWPLPPRAPPLRLAPPLLPPAPPHAAGHRSELSAKCVLWAAGDLTVLVQSGIAATVMTDARYPERVAINFLDMLLDEFTQVGLRLWSMRWMLGAVEGERTGELVVCVCRACASDH